MPRLFATWHIKHSDIHTEIYTSREKLNLFLFSYLFKTTSKFKNFMCLQRYPDFQNTDSVVHVLMAVPFLTWLDILEETVQKLCLQQRLQEQAKDQTSNHTSWRHYLSLWQYLWRFITLVICNSTMLCLMASIIDWNIKQVISEHLCTQPSDVIEHTEGLGKK